MSSSTISAEYTFTRNSVTRSLGIRNIRREDSCSWKSSCNDSTNQHVFRSCTHHTGFAIMLNMKSKLLFCLVVLLSIGNVFAQDRSALLYKVTGPGLEKPSYIFGTVHIVCQDEMFSMKTLGNYMKKTDRAFFELDFDDPKEMAALTAVSTTPQKDQVGGYYSKKELRKINELTMDTLGKPFDEVKGMNPVLLQTSIMTSPKAIRCEKAGSYDLSLVQMALINKFPIEGLETVDRQLKALSSKSTKEHAKSLLDIAKNPEKSFETIRRLMAAYKSESAASIYRVITDGSKKDKQFTVDVLDERNVEWIPVIEKAMKEKPSFFAFGAGHLAGRKGVLTLLEEKGYKLEGIRVQPDVRAELQGKLTAWHKKAKFPGATLAVVKADGTSMEFAVGYSDRDKKIKMKPSDPMLAGSVGKTFVSVVAMNLVSEGKLDLNANISTYLGSEPWFKKLPNGADIKVKHLLTHQTGLPRYEFDPRFHKDLRANPYKKWRPAEQIAYVFDSKPKLKAGEGWEYSDTNYILLGMIIEEVTGKKYNKFAKKLLKKHQLKRSKVQKGPKLKGLIQGYAGEGNEFIGVDRMVEKGKFAFDPSFEWTGGGIMSNSLDLARWAKTVYEGRAFDKGLLKEYLAGVSVTPNGRVKYGYGVFVRNVRGNLIYGHSGFFPGYLTEMMYFPKEKIAIAIQINTSVQKDVGRNPAAFLIEAKEIVTKK